MCVLLKMNTLRRCCLLVIVLASLVSEGQMWPQNFGSSNLRPPPIGDNKQPSDNTVNPRAPRRPDVQESARPAPRRPDVEEGARPARLPTRDDKKPVKPAQARPAQTGRSNDGPGVNVVDIISTTMQIAQSEGRMPGLLPNWNQANRPDKRRPSEAGPSHSSPVSRANASTTHGFKWPSGKPTTGRPGGRPDTIVFPNQPLFVPSDSCVNSGRTFCEARFNYPAEHIAKVLDANTASRFGSLFGADEVEVSNITQRFDAPPDDEALCMSEEKVIYPTAGQTRDDQWRFIVNQEKFLQGVRIEMCLEEEGKCRFSDSIPFGFRSFCKQKYIYRKLVSVAADGKSTTDEFKLPSCCSCHFQEVVTSRMAADVSPKAERRKRVPGRLSRGL